jgi:hypothetical protein
MSCLCEGIKRRQGPLLLQHLAIHLTAAVMALPPPSHMIFAREAFHISFCFIHLLIVNKELLLEYLKFLVYPML